MLCFITIHCCARKPTNPRIEFSKQSVKKSGGMFTKKTASNQADFLRQNNHALSTILDISLDERLILMLCGIPGSGKSTLATRIVNETTKFKAVCQDVLGKRDIVFSSAQSILDDGDSVIIDRCNFNKIQRSHWIKLSQLNNNVKVICLIMPDYLNVDVCSERAYNRKDEFHGENEDWKKICGIMKNDFQFPTYAEGISLIFECKNSSDMDEFVVAVAARGTQSDADSKSVYRERWARMYPHERTATSNDTKKISNNQFTAAFGSDSDNNSDSESTEK